MFPAAATRWRAFSHAAGTPRAWSAVDLRQEPWASSQGISPLLFSTTFQESKTRRQLRRDF